MRLAGLTGALIGFGIPEFEAKKYEGRLKKGGILFSVHCDTSEQVKRAKEIVERTGGEDVSSTAKHRPRMRTQLPAKRTTNCEYLTTANSQTMEKRRTYVCISLDRVGIGG